VIGKFFNVRLPSDGGPYTVNRGSTRIRDPRHPFASVHGAGYRGVYDLANPAKSRYIIAPGQSGNYFSSHYKDLAKRWRDGGYITMQEGSKNLELHPARDR
jgi:penicillin amidase